MIRRADLLRDRDALAAVVQRARANAGVGMAEAAEPVLVRPEEVRVDCADPDALLVRVAL